MSFFSKQNLSEFNIGRVILFSFVILTIVVFLLGFKFVWAKARDSKRMADMEIIQKALDIYYDRYHDYPATGDIDWGGWDSTYEPAGEPDYFIQELVDKKIINKTPHDPLNNGSYYYRYQKFEPGTYGCDRAFYVLQIINFESNISKHGYGSCPERDWTDEIKNGYTVQGFR